MCEQHDPNNWEDMDKEKLCQNVCEQECPYKEKVFVEENLIREHEVYFVDDIMELLTRQESYLIYSTV